MYGNLSLSLQCGAENEGKRKKKDRDLDELKKEVALVRKTGCHCPKSHIHCTVIDSIGAALETALKQRRVRDTWLFNKAINENGGP